jgi:hypothetical protein
VWYLLLFLKCNQIKISSQQFNYTFNIDRIQKIFFVPPLHINLPFLGSPVEFQTKKQPDEGSQKIDTNIFPDSALTMKLMLRFQEAAKRFI